MENRRRKGVIRGIVALLAGASLAVALAGCSSENTETQSSSAARHSSPPCPDYFDIVGKDDFGNCRSIHGAGYTIEGLDGVTAQATYTVPRMSCVDGSSGKRLVMGPPQGMLLQVAGLSQYARIGRACWPADARSPSGEHPPNFYFAQVHAGNYPSDGHEPQSLAIRPGDSVTLSVSYGPGRPCGAVIEAPARDVHLKTKGDCRAHPSDEVEIGIFIPDIGLLASPLIPDFGTVDVSDVTVNGKSLAAASPIPIDTFRYLGQRFGSYGADNNYDAFRRALTKHVNRTKLLAIKTSPITNGRDFTLTYVPAPHRYDLTYGPDD